MNCAPVKPLLSRHAERELPEDLRESVEAHLRACESCRWTVQLLECEEDALRSALRGGSDRPANSRSLRRLVAVAAVALVLLGGSLFALHRAYRQLGRETPDVASRSVLIRAEAISLREFVAVLSETSGVPIRLDDRVGEGPVIDFVLVTPVRLASVLAIIEDFHGLRSRPDGDGILIY